IAPGYSVGKEDQYVSSSLHGIAPSFKCVVENRIADADQTSLLRRPPVIDPRVFVAARTPHRPTGNGAWTSRAAPEIVQMSPVQVSNSARLPLLAENGSGGHARPRHTCSRRSFAQRTRQIAFVVYYAKAHCRPTSIGRVPDILPVRMVPATSRAPCRRDHINAAANRCHHAV